MLLLTFIGTLLFILLIRKYLAWSRMTTMIDKIEGPEYLPILGNILDFNIPPEEFIYYLVSVCDDSRSMVKLWFSRFLPYVFLYKADVVEEVLSSQSIITKSMDYDYLVPWLGTGLLISTGKKWSHRRKMITPAFHFKILEDFVDVFNQKTDTLINNLSEIADGREFDIYNHVAFCTLDIILETAMGLNMDVQGNKEAPYVNAVAEIVGIIQDRQKFPHLRWEFIFNRTEASKRHSECLKILHNLSLSTIRDRKKLYQQMKGEKKQAAEEVEGKKKRLPFLDLLLKYNEEEGQLTDDDIREEVDTFMFEGHDTTSTAINMTLFLLGSNPSIQTKLQEELDSVLEDFEESISSDKLKDLKYLECCIKESLRLYPSVPMFGRKSSEVVNIGGKDIPSGTSIMILTYKLHRDPKVFPDPEKFDPDRFLPENAVGRHAYSYVPFSAGPRNCIGQKFAMMEEKIILAKILKRFQVKSLDEQKNLKMMSEVILRPKDGIRVQLKDRLKK